MDSTLVVSQSKIADTVMTHLGNKVSTGQDLSISDRLMAMTASAQFLSDRYGPGPTEMRLKQPELPETVKGVLANYIGV